MANIHYVNPRGSMEQLSHFEVEMLTKQAKSALYQLYRNCSLAVLNSGAVTDDSRKLLSQYPDFDIELVATERGITLKLYNPLKVRLWISILSAIFSIIFCGAA